MSDLQRLPTGASEPPTVANPDPPLRAGTPEVLELLGIIEQRAKATQQAIARGETPSGTNALRKIETWAQDAGRIIRAEQERARADLDFLLDSARATE